MSDPYDTSDVVVLTAKLLAEGARVMVCRLNLAESQNWRCAYCAVEMEMGDPLNARHATRDHVVPRRDGGSDEWENLVAACRACNLSKGSEFDAVAFAWCRERMVQTGRWPAGAFPEAGPFKVFRRRVEARTYEALLQDWRMLRAVPKLGKSDRRRLRERGVSIGIVYAY